MNVEQDFTYLMDIKKDCCSNMDIKSDEICETCINCGIINTYKEKNEFSANAPMSNDLFPTYSMSTHIGGLFKNNMLYYIHKALNYNTQEKTLFKINDLIVAMVNKYTIPYKIVNYVLREYKNLYINEAIIFGGNIKLCLIFYLINEHCNPKLSIFKFLKDYNIHLDVYNRMLYKIDVDMYIAKDMHIYYKILIKYRIKMTFEMFIHHYNVHYKYAKAQNKYARIKTVLFFTTYNLLNLYNKKYDINYLKEFGLTRKIFYNIRYLYTSATKTS